MVLQNPNSPQPEPMGPMPELDLDDPVVAKVIEVLAVQINPQIAAHGGYAELVAVEGSIAYLRMGGGCQGCGMAAATLVAGDRGRDPRHRGRGHRGRRRDRPRQRHEPVLRGRQEVAAASGEAPGVLARVTRDGRVGDRVVLDGRRAPRPPWRRGSRHVISVAGMPVRTRERAHPTLAATSPCSLAIATMWHCGLPSMRNPGMASESTMSCLPFTRSSTTSGSTRRVAQRSVGDRSRRLGHDRDLGHDVHRHPPGLEERGDVAVARDLVQGDEAVREAAHRAVAVVGLHGRERGLGRVDPEHAPGGRPARSDRPRAAPGAGASNAATPVGRGVGEGDRDRGCGEREGTLQPGGEVVPALGHPNLSISAGRSRGCTTAWSAYSPHAVAGTAHITSNSLPSGSRA